MKEVVIVGGVRTPIGSHGGAFRTLTAQHLAATVFREVIDRVGIDTKLIDDVILGCIGQQSDAVNIARVAGLLAGVPVSVPGYTVQRNCVSGMQSITGAYQAIQSGDGEVYLCGGAESMSTSPYVVRGARWGLKLRHDTFVDTLWEGLTDPVCGQMMGLTAENLAMMYGISQEEQDKFAVQSHQKAFRATRMGRFRDEIVPVRVSKKVAGQEVAYEDIVQDECINPTLNARKAALYPTVFKKGGTVTPANACPISDGAAAVIVMTAGKAKELGLEPLATIRSFGSSLQRAESAGKRRPPVGRDRAGRAERGLCRPVDGCGDRIRGSGLGLEQGQRQRRGHCPGAPGGLHRHAPDGDSAPRDDQARSVAGPDHRLRRWWYGWHHRRRAQVGGGPWQT